MLLNSLKQRWNQRQSRKRRTVRNRRPALEYLEERITPAIVWDPVFGNEQAIDHGGPRLNSAPVFLIFWGPQWRQTRSDFNGPGDEQAIINGVRNFLSGPYQGELTRYGVNGLDRFYTAINDDVSAPASVGWADVGSEVERATKSAINRPSSLPQTPIYLLLLPPSYTSSLPNAGF